MTKKINAEDEQRGYRRKDETEVQLRGVCTVSREWHEDIVTAARSPLCHDKDHPNDANLRDLWCSENVPQNAADYVSTRLTFPRYFARLD